MSKFLTPNKWETMPTDLPDPEKWSDVLYVAKDDGTVGVLTPIKRRYSEWKTRPLAWVWHISDLAGYTYCKYVPEPVFDPETKEEASAYRLVYEHYLQQLGDLKDKGYGELTTADLLTIQKHAEDLEFQTTDSPLRKAWLTMIKKQERENQ